MLRSCLAADTLEVVEARCKVSDPTFEDVAGPFQLKQRPSTVESAEPSLGPGTGRAETGGAAPEAKRPLDLCKIEQKSNVSEMYLKN